MPRSTDLTGPQIADVKPVRGPKLVLIVTAVLAVLVSRWLIAAEHPGDAPAGNFEPRDIRPLMLEGGDAEAQRRELVRRAAVRLDAAVDPARVRTSTLPAGHALTGAAPSCRFMNDSPSGTSPKFDCILEGGEVIKVKYGRNPELHAEVAGTRLLRALGYAADAVEIIPGIRCYGCPRYPFLTVQVLSLVGGNGLLDPHGFDGYTDFEWVAVERKFPAPSIETDTEKGWAWWELERSTAPRADLDAFRLLAVFLAHWDNKAENQRLVCLDQPTTAGACAQPLTMIQDAGAVFGPSKVNLSRWREMPIWRDRSRCVVSMRRLPHNGATFPDAEISEAGRRQLADGLSRLTDADIRELFTAARFAEFHSASDDAHDLAAWTEAFRARVDQITDARCPV